MSLHQQNPVSLSLNKLLKKTNNMNKNNKKKKKEEGREKKKDILIFAEMLLQEHCQSVVYAVCLRECETMP